MSAAERMKLLPCDDNVPRPANEFQIRPFLRLAPEQFPGAWKQAVKSAKEGRVTTRIVQAVIHDLMPTSQGLAQANKGWKRSKSKAKLPVGRLLMLLYEAKQQVEKGETVKALAALENIESLLCRP